MLPESTKSIQDEAFINTGIESIYIPTGVLEIGKSSFANCPLLTFIYLPDTLNTISADAFDGSDHAIIVCTEDSYADQFAAEYHLPAVIINN